MTLSTAEVLPRVVIELSLAGVLHLSRLKGGRPLLSGSWTWKHFHSSLATPSSSHRYPQESQVHLYFWEGSSAAIPGSDARPSKTTSAEWHLGQRTGSSSSTSGSFGVGSS